MAKGVLGNDPFQRGAASRSAEPATGEAKTAAEAPAKKPVKGKSGNGAKASAHKAAAPGKTGGKAASAKSRKPEKKTAAKARGGKVGTASGKPGAAAHAPSPRAQARGPASHGPEDAALPLREPAAAEPFATEFEPGPVNDAGPLTDAQRDVDHALAEAVASEAAEVSATAAVEETLGTGGDPDAEVERWMATEVATELAERAVEALLEQDSPSRPPEQERELAASVAAQVADHAARAAADEAQTRHASAQEASDGARRHEFSAQGASDGARRHGFSAQEASDGARPHEFPTQGASDGARPHEFPTQGASDGARRHEFSAQEASDEARPHEFSAQEASDEARPHEFSAQEESEEALWAEEASVSVVVTDETDTTAVEPEVELPDATRDEFPPGRRGPLSLVPPPSYAEDGAREAFPPDAGRSGPESVRPLAERAVAALSLAKDIAGQALASESLARAMLAVGGLKDMLRAGLGTGGGANLDEYGKDPALVERLEPVLEFLYSQYWRVSVQGVVHVPPGAAILVANHSGALPYDGLVMSMALTRERPDLREPRWLVEDQVFHAPMVGTLFNRMGAVRACPENALRLLDEHRPLVVFPEGYQALSKPFGERYRLKRFGRGGFVKLALRTGAPIVPVAIVGAEETSPLLGRIPASFLGLPYVPLTPLGPLPLPAKWSIRFGEPIGVEDFPPEAADDLGEVQRLTERTRESIQSMLQSLLRERRSVFAG
ncbi:acyltransferase family protein [Myxococcus hansupus]|uniref:Acyltransferase family protein n=1 Tax=Pseudomyxococcus hansupus TaxID=1297742 RepID=A0A0H4WR37_9BACT|nr:1-acyl-sn-glycerol-3-phosphate acyltransferase [Myxococcus hansupus]AKQ65966.1 acyltransferase family protein [Myxococcus hansupus]